MTSPLSSMGLLYFVQNCGFNAQGKFHAQDTFNLHKIHSVREICARCGQDFRDQAIFIIDRDRRKTKFKTKKFPPHCISGDKNFLPRQKLIKKTPGPANWSGLPQQIASFMLDKTHRGIIEKSQVSKFLKEK